MSTLESAVADFNVGKLDWKTMLAQLLSTLGPVLIQVIIDALTKQPAPPAPPTPGPVA